jgi:hypothetical protein
MKPGTKPRPAAERFWPKVDQSGGPDACWPWTAYCQPNGYGEFDKKWAHRVAYELAIGPITPGGTICHTCDNPRCVNPSHLFLGTQGDNVRDMVAKGRHASQKRTHCPQGHEITGTFLAGGVKRRRYCRECNRIKTLQRYHAKKRARAQ